MEGAQSRSAGCFAVFGRVLGHLSPAGGRVLALRAQQRRHLEQVSVLSFRQLDDVFSCAVRVLSFLNCFHVMV